MFSPESEAWLTHEDRERLEDWSWVLSISTRGERTFLGRGAVLGGLGPGSQGAGACLRLGGGVMHFRVELSMMAVTRVLIGVLLRYCGAWRGLEPGLGPAMDSVREGLVKCAEARWEHAVVERDMPRPEILAPPPLTGDLERKHNQILFPFYRSVMFWRKVVFGTTNSQPSTLFGEIFKLSIYVPSSPDTEYSSLHFDISHSNFSLLYLAKKEDTPLSTDPPISERLRRIPPNTPEAESNSAAVRSTGWLAILSTSSRSSVEDLVLDTKAVSMRVCRGLGLRLSEAFIPLCVNGRGRN